MRGAPLRLAWQILAHRRGRLAAGSAAVALAVLIMFMELGFFHGFSDSQALLPPRFEADLVLMDWRRVHLNEWTELPALRLAQVAALPGVAEVVPVYNTAMTLRDPLTRQLRSINTLAFPPDSQALRVPGLAELAGRLKVRGNVLFDARSRAIYGPVTEGTLVTLENRPPLRVAGFFELGPNFSHDGTLLMGEGTYLAATGRPPGAPVDFALVRLRPGLEVATFRRQLLAALPPDTIALTPEEMRRREVAYTATVVPTGIIFGLALAVGFVIGVIVCYQVLFNEITDHLPQFATLQAMGFGDGFLRRIVLHQAWLVAVIGFGPGLAGGWWLYVELERRTGIVMEQTPGRVAFVFGLTLLMSFAASLLALRRATQSDPAEVFA